MRATFGVSVSSVILLVAVTLSSAKHSDECGNEDDCPVEREKICALDKDRVCFKHFDSLCHMRYKACRSDKEYLVYVEQYCNSPAFMCTQEYDDFTDWWKEYEDMDATIYEIYRKKSNATTRNQEFYNKMFNITTQASAKQ